MLFSNIYLFLSNKLAINRYARYNKNKRSTDRRLPRRTEKAKYEKPPFSSAKSIGGFSRESFPASPILGLRLLGNDSFFCNNPPTHAGKTLK